MSAPWPAGLPQDVLGGYVFQPRKGSRTTKMDSGPAKKRRRFTSAPRPFTVTIELTRDQVPTFLTFYEDTLALGTLPFTWVDPLTQDPVEFRFEGDEPPDIAHRIGNLWRIQMRLEVLP